MDSHEKVFVRIVFRLRVYEADGIIYQRLFERVLTYCDKGFVPIKPDGNDGDRKNDGYVPARGLFFQVFAPENPTSERTPSAAAKKALEDFEGLKKRWTRETPIREFRFAFNDKYKGSTPRIEEAIATIGTTHGIPASVFLAKDLEDEAMALADDQILDIVGAVPHAGLISSVDFGVLREVIDHVLQYASPVSHLGNVTAPDFSDKIAFNGLTSPVADLLRVGSYQSEAVREYFSRNSRFARQQLRDHLADVYRKARLAIEAKSPAALDFGNLVFFRLLEEIVPQQPSGSPALLQQAAIVVMAFYFEACDIFEDPNAPS